MTTPTRVRAEPRLGPPGSDWHWQISRRSIGLAIISSRRSSHLGVRFLSGQRSTPADTCDPEPFARWRRPGPRPDRVASRPERRLVSRVSCRDLRCGGSCSGSLRIANANMTMIGRTVEGLRRLGFSYVVEGPNKIGVRYVRLLRRSARAAEASSPGSTRPSAANARSTASRSSRPPSSASSRSSRSARRSRCSTSPLGPKTSSRTAWSATTASPVGPTATST